MTNGGLIGDRHVIISISFMNICQQQIFYYFYLFTIQGVTTVSPEFKD